MPDPIYVITPGTNGRKFTLEQIDAFGLSGKMGVQDEGKLSPAEAYAKVGWYKRCIDVRSRAVASLPWAVYTERGDDPVWTDETERPDALAWLRLRDALFTAEVSAILFGAAYALKERQGRKPTGLYWYNAATISPKYSGAEIAYLERRAIAADGKTITERLNPADVLQVYVPDAMREVGPGASDAAAALMSAQVLYDLDSYTSENLRSGLVKRTVFTAEGRRPPEEEARRVESWLTRFIMGRGKTDVKVMSGNVKAVEIGSNLADLGHKELSEQHREQIATALGVPHSLVMSNAANFATAQADQMAFLTTTVIPEARMIEDAINEQLLNPLGFDLKFEPERAEAMQSAQQTQVQTVVALYNAGVIDRNETRIAVGYDPEEEEEEETPAPPQEVPEEEEPEDDEQPVRSLDVRRWRTKVEKRGRSVKFMPDALREDEADEIRSRLAMGLDLDEVFEPPYAPASF